MKIAITEWQGRISPVFDVATQLLVAEVENGSIANQYTVKMHSVDFQARVQEIAMLGLEVLICGAISRPFELTLSNTGIKVIPHRCGEVEQALLAFTNGGFSQDAFLMPGCCERR